jgi:hypothetical protein
MPTTTSKLTYANFNPSLVVGKTPIPAVFIDFNYGVRLVVPSEKNTVVIYITP